MNVVIEWNPDDLGSNPSPAISRLLDLKLFNLSVPQCLHLSNED